MYHHHKLHTQLRHIIIVYMPGGHPAVSQEPRIISELRVPCHVVQLKVFVNQLLLSRVYEKRMAKEDCLSLIFISGCLLMLP